MGLFDIFKKKSWEERSLYTGETPPCPECGKPLTKKYVFSGMYCSNCNYGLYDDDHDDEESGLLYNIGQLVKLQ